jgi:hypothetical protein
MLQTDRASTLPTLSISSVLDQILATGQIAQPHAQQLLRAGMTLETALSHEEEAKLNQIFYRLGLGILKVV